MPSGFKVWATGDLVSAADFNDYIMEQVIMTFANSTARDSAVSSPEALAGGGGTSIGLVLALG
jgi:hypothetical protein